MNRLHPWLATAAALTLAAAAPAASQDRPLPRPARAASPAPERDAQLSKRALRRARLLIEMRLLELREERLECARSAILRHLPPDLLPPGTGQSADAVKQSSALRATTPRSAVSKSEDCGWLSMQPKRRRPMA
jgi:hypothetical protein